jgi:hypothetical protein
MCGHCSTCLCRTQRSRFRLSIAHNTPGTTHGTAHDIPSTALDIWSHDQLCQSSVPYHGTYGTSLQGLSCIVFSSQMAHTKRVKHDKGAQTPIRASPRKGPGPSKEEEELMTSDVPGQEVELTTRDPPGEDSLADQETPPSQPRDPEPSRRTSTSSQLSDWGTQMYRPCTSCNKGNQLATSDLHEDCIACLGFSHLQTMTNCRA